MYKEPTEAGWLILKPLFLFASSEINGLLSCFVDEFQYLMRFLLEQRKNLISLLWLVETIPYCIMTAAQPLCTIV